MGNTVSGGNVYEKYAGASRKSFTGSSQVSGSADDTIDVHGVSDLMLYNTSNNSKVKEDLALKVIEIAKMMNINVSGSTVEQKLKSFLDAIPNGKNGKKFSDNPESNKKVCQNVAKAINAAFGSDVIDANRSPEGICKQIYDYLHSLTVEGRKEFLAVAKDVSTIIENLNILQRTLVDVMGKIAKSVNANCNEMGKTETGALTDYLRVLDQESKHQLGLLSNLLKLNIKPIDRDLIVLMRADEGIQQLFDEKRTRTTDLIQKVLNGIGAHSFRLTQVNEALKKVNLSLDEFNQLPNRDRLDTLLLERLKSFKDDKNVFEFIRAMEYLRRVFNQRKEISSEVHGSDESVDGEHAISYDGGAARKRRKSKGGVDYNTSDILDYTDRDMNTFERKSHTKMVSRKLYLDSFDRVIKTKLSGLVSDIHGVSDSFDDSVVIDDDMMAFIRALDKFDPTNGNQPLHFMFSGIQNDALTREKRDTYMVELNRVLAAIEKVLGRSDLAGSKDSIRKLKDDLKGFVDFIQSQSTDMQKRFGNTGIDAYTGSGCCDGGDDVEEPAESDEVESSTVGGATNFSGYSIQKWRGRKTWKSAVDKLKYLLKAQQVSQNIKKSAVSIKEFSEEYDDKRGIAIAEKISALMNQRNSAIELITKAHDEHKKNDYLLAREKQPTDVIFMTNRDRLAANRVVAAAAGGVLDAQWDPADMDLNRASGNPAAGAPHDVPVPVALDPFYIDALGFYYPEKLIYYDNLWRPDFDFNKGFCQTYIHPECQKLMYVDVMNVGQPMASLYQQAWAIAPPPAPAANIPATLPANYRDVKNGGPVSYNLLQKINAIHRDEYIKFIKNYYDSKINMWKTVECVDEYMRVFSDGLLNNLDSVNDLVKYFDNLESIQDAYEDKSGDHLQAVFDSFPCQEYPIAVNLPSSKLRNGNSHYYKRISDYVESNDNRTVHDLEILNTNIGGGTDMIAAADFASDVYSDRSGVPAADLRKDNVTHPAFKSMYGKLGDPLAALRISFTLAFQSMISELEQSIKGVKYLKNLLNIFLRVGNKYGGQELHRKAFLTPIQIYDNLCNYMIYSSLTLSPTIVNNTTTSSNVTRLTDGVASIITPYLRVPNVMVQLSDLNVRCHLGLVPLNTGYVAGPPVVPGTDAVAVHPLTTFKDSAAYTIEFRGPRIANGINRAAQNAAADFTHYCKDATDHYVADGVRLINTYDVGRDNGAYKTLSFNGSGSGHVINAVDNKSDRELSNMFDHIIKAMSSKVLTVMNAYKVKNRPIDSKSYNAFRMITGGDAASVKDDAIELYVRLLLLLEFYRDLFKWDDSDYYIDGNFGATSNDKDAKKIALIPDIDGVFSGVFNLMFIKAKNSKHDSMSDSNLNYYIGEVNNIWERLSPKYPNGDAVRGIMQECANEVNRRYGLLKIKERDAFKSWNATTYNYKNFNNSSGQLSNATEYDDSILPDEDESDINDRQVTPSDRYVNAPASLNNKARAVSDKYVIDELNYNLFYKFRCLLDSKLMNKQSNVDGDELHKSIKLAKKNLEDKMKDDKLSAVKQLIRGSSSLTQSDNMKCLLFHETVVTGLTALNSITTLLANFRSFVLNDVYKNYYVHTVNNIQYKTVLKHVSMFMDMVSPGVANGDNVAACNIAGWGGAIVVNPAVPGGAQNDATRTLIRNYINRVDSSDESVIRLHNYQGLDPGLVGAVNNTSKFKNRLYGEFFTKKTLRALFEHIYMLDNETNGLIKVGINSSGSDSLNISIDWSGLKDQIDKLFSSVKYFLETLKPYVSSSVYRMYSDKEVVGSLYWLQEHLYERLLEGRNNVSEDYDNHHSKNHRDFLVYTPVESLTNYINKTLHTYLNDEFKNPAGIHVIRAANRLTLASVLSDMTLGVIPGLYVNWACAPIKIDADNSVDKLLTVDIGDGNRLINPSYLGRVVDIKSYIDNETPLHRHNRCLVLDFNRALLSYIDMFYDRNTHKIYKFLVEKVSMEVLNNQVMDQSITISDVARGHLQNAVGMPNSLTRATINPPLPAVPTPAVARLTNTDYMDYSNLADKGWIHIPAKELVSNININFTHTNAYIDSLTLGASLINTSDNKHIKNVNTILLTSVSVMLRNFFASKSNTDAEYRLASNVGDLSSYMKETMRGHLPYFKKIFRLISEKSKYLQNIISNIKPLIINQSSLIDGTEYNTALVDINNEAGALGANTRIVPTHPAPSRKRMLARKVFGELFSYGEYVNGYIGRRDISPESDMDRNISLLTQISDASNAVISSIAQTLHDLGDSSGFMELSNGYIDGFKNNYKKEPLILPSYCVAILHRDPPMIPKYKFGTTDFKYMYGVREIFANDSIINHDIVKKYLGQDKTYDKYLESFSKIMSYIGDIQTYKYLISSFTQFDVTRAIELTDTFTINPVNDITGGLAISKAMVAAGGAGAALTPAEQYEAVISAINAKISGIAPAGAAAIAGLALINAVAPAATALRASMVNRRASNDNTEFLYSVDSHNIIKHPTKEYVNTHVHQKKNGVIDVRYTGINDITYSNEDLHGYRPDNMNHELSSNNTFMITKVGNDIQRRNIHDYINMPYVRNHGLFNIHAEDIFGVTDGTNIVIDYSYGMHSLSNYKGIAVIRKNYNVRLARLPAGGLPDTAAPAMLAGGINYYSCRISDSHTQPNLYSSNIALLSVSSVIDNSYKLSTTNASIYPCFILTKSRPTDFIVSAMSKASFTESIAEITNLYCAANKDTDVTITNIIDMNINPINVHALMRSIPLANLYNYSYTFDRYIIETFYGVGHEFAKVLMDNLCNSKAAGISDTNMTISRTFNGLRYSDNSASIHNLYPYTSTLADAGNHYHLNANGHEDGYRSTKELFVALLVNPNLGMVNLPFQFLFTGESNLPFDRPKYLSDQVYNKSLLQPIAQWASLSYLHNRGVESASLPSPNNASNVSRHSFASRPNSGAYNPLNNILLTYINNGSAEKTYNRNNVIANNRNNNVFDRDRIALASIFGMRIGAGPAGDTLDQLDTFIKNKINAHLFDPLAQSDNNKYMRRLNVFLDHVMRSSTLVQQGRLNSLITRRVMNVCNTYRSLHFSVTNILYYNNSAIRSGLRSIAPDSTGYKGLDLVYERSNYDD